MLRLRSKVSRSILGFFILNEKSELYVNELARRLGLDSGNLSRKLAEFEGYGILRSRTRGEHRFFSLNKEFPHSAL